MKCGYCGWHIDELLEISVLQHRCFELFNEEAHLLYVDDNNIVTIIEKDQPSSSRITDSDDYNESIITAVQSRPGLYDHRIPLKERTHLKKQSLWNEVLNVVGGNDLESVQKRWKQLRDCYIKSKRKIKEYIPSGSAGCSTKNAKSTFRFYEQMKFLDDVLKKSATVTSLPEKTSTSDVAEDIDLATADPVLITVPQSSNSTDNQQSFLIDDVTPSPSYQKRTSKRSKSSDDRDIRAAICSVLESESVRKRDAVDGFLLQIGDRLRALPIRERHQFEIKILYQLYDLEQELSTV